MPLMVLHSLSARAPPSAPLVLSTLACVLSACALLVAIGAARGGAGAASLTAEQAPALSHAVTLSGLQIARGELAAGAVDAPALADGAVGTRALADAAVTRDKLADDAIREIARHSAVQAASVVGEVDEAGSVVRGTGFSAARVGTGEFVLSFDEPFLAPPVVVAVAQSYAVCSLPAAAIGLASVRIKVRRRCLLRAEPRRGTTIKGPSLCLAAPCPCALVPLSVTARPPSCAAVPIRPTGCCAHGGQHALLILRRGDARGALTLSGTGSSLFYCSVLFLSLRIGADRRRTRAKYMCGVACAVALLPTRMRVLHATPKIYKTTPKSFLRVKAAKHGRSAVVFFKF